MTLENFLRTSAIQWHGTANKDSLEGAQEATKKSYLKYNSRNVKGLFLSSYMQNKQEFSLCFSSTQCVFVDPTEVPAYVACRDGSQLGLERALSVYRCDDRLALLKKQFVKETLEAGKSG